MESLLTMFSSIFLAVGSAAVAEQRVLEPPEQVFERAEHALLRQTDRHRALLTDDISHFEVDLEGGIITFAGDGNLISAPIQVVGTYNTLDETFLWAWDHPSVPEALAADARLAREFGRRHDLSLFTTRKVDCSEDEAWFLAGVTFYLAGAEGVYRAPYGTTMVFLTYGELTITPAD